jgi:hypothetical protein
MEVTSTHYKNSEKIDEKAYEKFVKAQMKAIKRSWSLFNHGEELTEAELREHAETVCSAYRHQFRELVPANK